MREEIDNSDEILSSIFKKISAPDSNLRAMMERVLGAINELIRFDVGSILVKDQSENALRLVAVQGDIATLPKREHIYPIDKGIQSIVLQTGKPYVCEDINNDDNYVRVWEGVRSEVAIPIVIQHRVLGIISLESFNYRIFTNEELQIVGLLADQIVVAINMEKLRFLEEARRVERELLAKETCFVLMPFSEPFNKYYTTVVVPAIEATGLRPVRADSLFGPASVMEDIWMSIKKSNLLIAELTTRNPNVMYELGLAHAMEKAVVLLTQNIEDVPFDLQSIRCIVYDTKDPEWSSKLRGDITKYIEAIMLEGKKKKRFRPFSRK